MTKRVMQLVMYMDSRGDIQEPMAFGSTRWIDKILISFCRIPHASDGSGGIGIYALRFKSLILEANEPQIKNFSPNMQLACI